MSPRTSPTARRRRLAAELRRLRKEAGLTREQVAEVIGCAPATITRFEIARSGPRVGEVALMLELYGITGAQRDALLKMAKEARRRGWWHPYSGAIPTWFETYVSLEEEAATIRAYESECVPGLLQTAGYMRAVTLAEPVVPGAEEIDRRVAVRMERQARLSGDEAPAIWAVLNEAAVRRQVGGRETMRDQLERLMEVSRLHNVTLQILPFEAGAHPGMDGAFTILGFPESMDPDVVYVEYRAGSLYLEGRTEVDTYNLMFDHLRARALSPDESQALIAKVHQDLR
ncbi:transcriptional regulator [Sphaerisporangium siamense]|uniref:Transcriptional regulator with XRE-family HTH domain n=1 Tax=Sphaerisporangium siamense TaxID=795645 RepID=A0A7W7D8S0_9ACTN|nr:helix-turn-helix transcriptional regulator [Sphaerisporangium siamense]MBB4700908.1 transcriptional regulator with XRE-family HTH domain [Sphaerisporangium siamense]GII85947.1 transcriptional regulator [Sphaerisporangium siamense]